MKTHIMFRILGEDMDPDKITGALSIVPTKAHAKNHKHTVPRGGVTIQRPTGHWSFCTEKLVSTTEVADHAKYLLGRLEPNQSAIACLLNDPLLRIGISVWWEIDYEHGSFAIPSDIMRRLALLCHDIEFHFIGTFEGDSRLPTHNRDFEGSALKRTNKT
jgi:hypothetical protein